MSLSLPVFHHRVTARDIVMGAAASHDWQPQHHDDAYAREMHLPGIIMNTPTQTGWFHAYARRWAGEGARIARWRLQMRQPLGVGAAFTLSGKLLGVQPTTGGRWVWLGLQMTVAEALFSSMRLLLAQPLAQSLALGGSHGEMPIEAAPPLGDEGPGGQP